MEEIKYSPFFADNYDATMFMVNLGGVFVLSWIFAPVILCIGLPCAIIYDITRKFV